MLRRLMIAGNAGGDPLKANVVALLRFDGENGSTTFIDETGRTWLPSNVSIDNSVTLIAGGSGVFLGPASPSSLGTSKAGLAMTGDFCIEAAVRLTAMPGSGRIAAILSTGNLSSNYYGLRWFISETGQVGLYLSNNGSLTTDIFSAAGVIATGQTYRMCVERKGTTVRVFVDGVIVATGVFAGTVALSTGTPMAYTGTAVDRSQSSSEQGRLHGRIDEFRWTIGAYRYAGTYTPDSGPFPY